MAVKITLIGKDEKDLPIFEAIDLENNEPVVIKNWFEKSKDKWHAVLAANSANRKYIAHNEFFAKAKDGEYIVEDKTTGPRTMGTAQPDAKLVPYMTDEDKETYNAIIDRAKANRESQKAKPLSAAEKIELQIKKLQEKLAAKKAEVQTSADED